MDPFRLLMTPTVLQRAVHLVRRFDQCRCGLRAFSKKSIAALDAANDGIKKPRPKTVEVPKITLISLDNSITVTILEDAQRLAKRRNLTLTKITDFDSKTQRAVYKLLSNSDHIEETDEIAEVEDKDKDEQKLRSEKMFYISAKIAEHDLKTKLKNIVKLLNKKHKIKLVIKDDSHENKTKSIIQDMIKDHGSIQQMQSKKNMALLVITPLSNNDTSANSKETISANSQSNNA
ncbi:hypothetical protein DMN91_009406 [Ooceraea biroi]|uniref:Translation initiation factor IF-3, mitochondrial n=1 Tax=Ooceraea biroi TaxID=2015173 RepID=A0A3L8DGQ3_OOCBI|nr:uncharacterized protein LOC105284705 [Ooceraea biroi]XP_026827920.1 uncharacterized protein LOC105284705 [Ooceraea biroi]RLU19048.1 hypothetical protein DMN91_009406 [Ooceraea biroi]